MLDKIVVILLHVGIGQFDIFSNKQQQIRRTTGSAFSIT